MAMNSCGSVAIELMTQARPNSPGASVASVFTPYRAFRPPTSGMTSAAGTRNDTMNQTEM